MDWTSYYPAIVTTVAEGQTSLQIETNEMGPVRRLKKDVEVADIGCGFGGLLVALAPILPDTLLLGMPSVRSAADVLTSSCRHGDPNTSHRICPRTNQSSTGPERAYRSLPKCGMLTSQRYEVLAKLLQEAPTMENIPLLS